MKTNDIYTRINSQLLCRRLTQDLISSQCIKAHKTRMIAPVIMFEIVRNRQSVSGTIPRNCTNTCNTTFTTTSSGENFKILNSLALFVAVIATQAVTFKCLRVICFIDPLCYEGVDFFKKIGELFVIYIRRVLCRLSL